MRRRTGSKRLATGLIAARKSLRVLPFLVGMAGAALPIDVRASSAVSVYGVSNYTNCGANNTSGAAEATGFQCEMLDPSSPQVCNVGSTIWTSGLTRTDTAVGQFDFIDAQRLAGGNDFNSTSGFDRADDDAFAYYAGHGVAPPSRTPTTACTKSSECTGATRPANTSLPGVCAAFPPAANPVPAGCTYTVQIQPYCSYAWSHQLALCPGATLKIVNYSNRTSPSWMALGESNTQGWAGVGFDGGVNVAIFSMSFPFEPGTEPVDADVFAGLHMWLALGSNRQGDTSAADPGRGAWFAYGYAAYGQNQLVRQAWFNVATYLMIDPEGGSGCCAGTGSNQTGNSPGSGINGCGSFVALSKGATTDEANGLNSQTWIQVSDNSTDATGSGGQPVLNRFCNYDCATYPPVLPN